MEERFGQYGQNRFWEMAPGLLVWSTLVLAILLSFVAPVVAAIFIIVFDLYWTLRVVYFVIHVAFSYSRYRKDTAIDWYTKLQEVEDWDSVHHLIMLPTYKESLPIIRSAIKGIRDSKYRNDRCIVVLGGEEGDKEQFLVYKEAIEKEFKGVFKHLMFTIHPKGIEGEIPGKGSNMKWMGEQVKSYVDKEKVPYEHIVVSAFDVDTIAHEQYFARLAYLFLTEPNPLRTSYQPLTLFSNNIWKASAPVRVASFGTTFWLLGELVRPERMWTFSSHSMPWQMLVDVGFWEPDLVSEDSRIFMQGFLRYDGDYRVTPIFLPVHMDAVEGDGYIDALKALYKQQRRWAWGMEHLAYMWREFKKHPKISRWQKFRYMFNDMEGRFTQSTAPLLIFALGYLPFWVSKSSPVALVANAPFTLERMMQVATLGVFVSGAMSLLFLPRRPGDVKPWNWLVMIAQWALLPVTFIVFSAFPAIDAQTRFMLGKYLGFNVTKKIDRTS